MTKRPEPMLWLDDARGIYIPRDFAKSFKDRAKHVSGVTDEDWAILENPDHEYHWETWNDVLDNAKVTDDKGIVYFLHQDGDLWLVPEGMVWDDDDGWTWEEDKATKHHTLIVEIDAPGLTMDEIIDALARSACDVSNSYEGVTISVRDAPGATEDEAREDEHATVSDDVAAEVIRKT